MRLKKYQLYLKTVAAEDLPLEQLPVKGEVLLVMDFWDGGAKEGCLFVEKKADTFVLWEYVYPYATRDGEVTKQNIETAEELSTVCQKRYTTQTPIDFTQIPQNDLQTFLRK